MQLPTQQTNQPNIYTLGSILTLRPTSWNAQPPGPAYEDDIKVKQKGKAAPLEAWSGPEGSRKLRFPDFMTTAQDGGKVVILTHQPPLPPGNIPGTHFC